jgi:hypothetical protein
VGSDALVGCSRNAGDRIVRVMGQSFEPSSVVRFSSVCAGLVVRASQIEPSFLVVAALLGSQIRTVNT